MEKSRIKLFVILVAAIIGVDQYSKIWARQTLQGTGTKSYFNDVFRLIYVENTGAFLSMGSSLSDTTSMLLLTVVPILLLSLLVYFIFKKNYELTTMNFVGLCCILAGGASNIADRIMFDKHVTDFMNMGFGDLRTGIFNIADVSVSTGAIIILLFSNKKRKKEG